MADAERSTKNLGSSVQHSTRMSNESMKRMGLAGLAAGGALALGLGKVVSTAMGFEKQMSGVKAVAGATAGEMDLLGKAALKAGADTVFSASEAAQAEAELVKAGISTSDVLGGALSGSLNLAAAGQLDLANAAEISAQSMNIFGLEGSDVAHIADVLAAGANKSAADVGQLGDALRQGGLVAAQTGLSLEETVGALSAFSDSALVGSDAGTSLKTMLQRLTPQSKEAAELMEELGFSAYDAQGNFVGLEGLAGELQTSLAGMSVEQRNAAMATLFGSDAVRGANVLYKLGAEGIRDYVTAVDDQGAATRMAATLTDNLSGDLEALGGSLETLFITSGEGATGPLRLVVQTATELLNAVGELPGPLKTAGIGLTGISSAGLLSLGAIGTLVPRVREARVELANLGTAGASANRALGFLGKAGAYGAGLTVLHVALSELGKRVDDLIRGTPEVDKVTAALTDLASGAGSIEAVGRAARGNQNDLRQFLDMVENPKGSSEADAGRSGLTKMLEDIDLALRDMVLGGAPAKAAEALRLFAQESDVRVPEVLPYLSEYRGALDSAAASAKVADAAAEEAGLSTLGLSDATGQAMTSAAGLAEELDALDEEVSSLTTSYDYLLGRTLAVEEAQISSRGALRDLITTIEEGQEENESLAEHQDRVTSSLIRLIEQVNQEYEALVRAGEASGTTADRNEFLRGRLDQVANALPGLRGQIADYQAKLDNSSVAAQLASGEAHNLAASLARLKSPEPIRITVDTSAADAALERFFGSMGRTIEARLRLDATTVNARGDGPGRGGPALSRVNSVLAGIPGAYVTSTYRTPEQNRRVGGSPTSYHLDKSNPAVDIGGRNLGLVASRLRSMGGWREGPLWQVPGHFDHVHVAHQGGMVAPTWPKMAGLGPDERMGLLQVGERVLNRSETAIYNSTVPASVSPAGGKNIIHNHYETKVTIEGSLWHVREAERAIDKVRRERAYQGGR